MKEGEEKKKSHLRLQAENVAHQLAFIPLIVAHLAGPVDHLDGGHPLVDSEITLPGKVMDMLDETAHDFAHPRRGIWTHGPDHILGEFLAERGNTVGLVGDVLDGTHVVQTLNHVGEWRSG